MFFVVQVVFVLTLQATLSSVCSSVRLSIHRSVDLSVHPFCLPFFLSRSFSWNLDISFCDIWHGIRALCGIICGIFKEKSGLGKKDQKMVKNSQKM